MGNILATKIEDRRNEELSDEEANNSSRPEWMSVSLPRVPPHVRERNKDMYDPLLVSLGPYHHGQPQLRRFEDIKLSATKLILMDSEEKRLALQGKILERIVNIRSFYGGVSRDEYDDEALAGMILRDACFVVYYIKMCQIPLELRLDMHCHIHIGIAQLTSMKDDIFRLENQIPWWVIKTVISSTYDDDEGEAIIIRSLSLYSLGDLTTLKSVPWKEQGEPLHLLDAIRSVCMMTTGSDDSFAKVIEDNLSSEANSRSVSAGSSCLDLNKCNIWQRKKRSQGGLAVILEQAFRSVTELKAKGIHFKPSSCYINDFRFTSHSLYGVLHLPTMAVSRTKMVYLFNAIALETSPASHCEDLATMSYVSFMKTLIQDTKDVIELQEKGILFNYLGDNEEIVRMFKEMDIYGPDYLFYDVKTRLNEHCNSKAKTWIADLINSYFRTPWTAIALIAATILLCLTFLQTYYTMNPRKNGEK